MLREKGVFVIPDILANAGGVSVSYFEWVQGLMNFFWKEADVHQRLKEIMDEAFDAVYDESKRLRVIDARSGHGSCGLAGSRCLQDARPLAVSGPFLLRTSLEKIKHGEALADLLEALPGSRVVEIAGQGRCGDKDVSRLEFSYHPDVVSSDLPHEKDFQIAPAPQIFEYAKESPQVDRVFGQAPTSEDPGRNREGGLLLRIRLHDEASGTRPQNSPHQRACARPRREPQAF